MSLRRIVLPWVGCAVIVLMSTGAHAGHVVGSPPWEEGVKLDAGIAYSTVSAGEFVYDDSIVPGYKLSELDWKADLLVAGGTLSFRQQRWVASAGAWTSLESLDGSMVDYDWLYPEIPDWSDRSIGGADLDWSAFDLNLGFTIFNSPDLAVDLVVGYREDELSWADFGGTYIYSSYGFRDDVGMFDDETGITFDQSVQLPYLGLHAHARVQQALTLSGYLLYSTLGEVTDEDHHILTGTHFEDEFSDVEYLGLGLHANWQVNAAVHVGLGVDYQNIPETVGDSTVVEEGETYTDGAGMSLETTTVSLSAGYSF